MSPASLIVAQPTRHRQSLALLIAVLLLLSLATSTPASAAPTSAPAKAGIYTAVSATARASSTTSTKSPTAPKSTTTAKAATTTPSAKPTATAAPATSAASGTAAATGATTGATTGASPTWGLYAGPGPKGPKGAQDFTAQSKIPVKHVLDFLPAESWQKMTTATWLTNAYRNSGYQLELSVPMLPDNEPATLAQCGNGSYNVYWKAIAQLLLNAGQPTAIVRPGWEFNGNWYKWSSAGQPQNYISCFRQIVTSMRSVAPGLTFAWCVNGGDNKLDGVLGYPGDGYVDYVTVDVYDYDYRTYSTAMGAQAVDARSNSWDYILKAKRGLSFWAGWAKAQGKPFAVSEWAMAWRSDGRAGGDNLTYLNGMYDFIVDPTNQVSWATYFNGTDSATLKHNISIPDTAFPNARAAFFARAGR